MSCLKTQVCDSSASPGEKLGKRGFPRSHPVLPSETPDLFTFQQENPAHIVSMQIHATPAVKELP